MHQVGGYLAEPKTAEQMKFLTGLAGLEADFLGVPNWWIGLTDSGHEGTWSWMHSMQVRHKVETKCTDNS